MENDLVVLEYSENKKPRWGVCSKGMRLWGYNMTWFHVVVILILAYLVYIEWNVLGNIMTGKAPMSELVVPVRNMVEPSLPTMAGGGFNDLISVKPKELRRALGHF